MRFDHVLASAPEFLGDENLPDGSDPTAGDGTTVTPGGAGGVVRNVADLRAAIAGAGGALYVWALPPAYPSAAQVALTSSAFKVQPDLANPGTYKITLSAAGAAAAPGGAPAGLSLAGLGLDSNTIIYGGVLLVAGLIVIRAVR